MIYLETDEIGRWYHTYTHDEALQFAELFNGAITLRYVSYYVVI